MKKIRRGLAKTAALPLNAISPVAAYSADPHRHKRQDNANRHLHMCRYEACWLNGRGSLSFWTALAAGQHAQRLISTLI